MPTEMEKVEDVNAHLDRLGWSNGFYGRLLNVKKKAMRRWLKGEKGYSSRPRVALDYVVCFLR